MERIHRISTIAILQLLIFIGILFIVIPSATMPQFRDSHWQERFHGVNVTIENGDSLSAVWNSTRKESVTARDLLIDIGTGITLFAISLLILFTIQGIQQVRDVANITTPQSKTTFYIIATVTWIAIIPLDWIWLIREFDRYIFPSWADSMIIPMFGILMGVIITLPFVLFGAILTLRKADLPTNLWKKPIWGRPYSINICLIVAILLTLHQFIISFFREPVLIPVWVLILYLLLSGRAAAITTNNIEMNTST